MKAFIDSRAGEATAKNEDKLSTLKKEMNTLINALYEDIATYAFSIDPYRLPVHGIPQSEMENPVNLF